MALPPGITISPGDNINLIPGPEGQAYLHESRLLSFSDLLGLLAGLPDDATVGVLRAHLQATVAAHTLEHDDAG